MSSKIRCEGEATPHETVLPHVYQTTDASRPCSLGRSAGPQKACGVGPLDREAEHTAAGVFFHVDTEQHHVGARYGADRERAVYCHIPHALASQRFDQLTPNPKVPRHEDTAFAALGPFPGVPRRHKEGARLILPLSRPVSGPSPSATPHPPEKITRYAFKARR